MNPYESSMVTRIAQVIYETRNGAGYRHWSRLPQVQRDPYLAESRAVLKAMREPTEAMMRAYEDAQPSGIGAEGWASADDALAAMVDAALSEPPSSTEGAS